MRNWIIATLIAIVAVGGTIAALAQGGGSTARVEVTVWQRVSDGALYLSTRPEGGRWTTHSEPLDMSAVSASGNFRQGSAVTVEVPVEVAAPEPPSASSVSASGTGPYAAAFVLSDGIWICNSAFVGERGHYALSLYGKAGDWELLVNETTAGDHSSVIRVGPGYRNDAPDIATIEVKAPQSAEWSITCERQ